MNFNANNKFLIMSTCDFLNKFLIMTTQSTIFSPPAQAPNAMRLLAERPSRADRQKYKTAVYRRALYSAASRLWMKGVDIVSAISIVESAMREAGEIE